jgi:acyl-coenzyme A synthetase/AMP-(fatty) acid ligase
MAPVIATVPHHHLYGLLFRLLWPLCGGRPFAVRGLLEPTAVVAALGRANGGTLVSSPAHLRRWPAYDGLARAGLRRLFSSGGPLPEETARRVAAETGLPVTEVYGSTEAGGIAWRAREFGPAEGAGWHAFARLEHRVDGLDRLSVRSPATGGQWLDTGDRARVLADGFELLGRADGVVKVEDRRLSLAEMERLLVASPLVEEVRLLLLPGRRTRVAAAVVLSAAGRRRLESEGAWAMRQSLRGVLAGRFEEVVLPRHFRYLEGLPRNEMGKVPLVRLEALFEETG